MSSGSVDPAILEVALGTAVLFGLSTLLLAARFSLRSMNIRAVWGVLSFTFKEAVRTKWLIVFALVFFLLAADLPVKILSDFGAVPARYMQQSFGVLLLDTFPLIPLLALPMGAVSIVEDRESGTMQYLLSNPMTKFEFFFGRISGLLAATTTVIFAGFGGAAIFAYASDASQFGALLILTLTAGLLNAVMLAIALIISEVAKRKATAIGAAIFVWLLLTTVSGLDTLSYAIYWKESAAAAVSVILLDPVETSRITAVEAAHLNQSQSFGQSDYLALHFLGNNLLSVAVASVLAWLVCLSIVGFLIFSNQDGT